MNLSNPIASMTGIAVKARCRVGICLAAIFFLSAIPVLAWSHPGHGLDGLWLHDALHAATAAFAIALVVLLAVQYVRHRKSDKRD